MRPLVNKIALYSADVVDHLQCLNDVLYKHYDFSTLDFLPVRTTSRQNLKALDIEKKENGVESRYVYDVKTTTRLEKKRGRK